MFRIIIFKEALTATVILGALLILLAAALPPMVDLFQQKNKNIKN